MRKIIVWMIMVALIFSVFGMSGIEALNHHGGGTTGHDVTFKGLNLTGYHWICYENDDWGGPPGIINATVGEELVTKQVKNAGFWLNNTLESASDMDDLFAVFAKHSEVVVTSFFIVDFFNGTAMESNGFTEFVGVPINKTGWIEETPYNSSGPNYRGDVTSKWKEGYNQGYWLPQYHGRWHIDMDWLLQNASEGCTTTIDCIVNYTTSPSKLFGVSQVGKSEYMNNALLTADLGYSNKTTPQVQANISVGLQEFYNLFGFYSESTVAPNYYLSNNTIAAFKNTTIYGHTGAPGYGLDDSGDPLLSWNWEQFDYFNGVSTLGRLISFNEINITHLSAKMDDINTTFDRGQVAIIEDHKVAYTSGIRDVTAPGERESALLFLDEFLTGVKTWYPDVWYLTSPELHQLNIRGYSIQNWTSSIVVRNALNETGSITVDLPPGWDANIVTVTNDTNVSKDFTKDDSRTITLNMPHNETFTVHRNFGASPPSYSEYDFSGIQALVMAAAIIVIIVVLVLKGMVGPISGSFGKMK